MTIQITEYTDPGCPFAWSAEPTRRRLEWVYGDGLEIELTMVGLHASAASAEDHGLSTAMIATGIARLAEAHHMPMDTREPPRLSGTLDACRAVVAVRRHAPERERAMLHGLRLEGFGGRLLDESSTLRAAADRAGVDPEGLERWVAEPETEAALEADLRAARDPSDEALALPRKLASTDEGGQRYTCPSWELSSDGRRFSVPGFQPLAAYELAIANLAPGLARRAVPDEVAEVLAWAGEPLATAEVAAVCGIELATARERLGEVAAEEHLGTDGVWTLR